MEKIERLHIPDDDAVGWTHSLQEAGFSQAEIDLVMIHLNDEYASRRLHTYLEEWMQITKADIGRKLTLEQEKELRRILLDELRGFSKEELEQRAQYKA